MAVRLLVSFNREDTRDWEALEKLAGVPAGTWRQAAALEQRIDNLRRADRHAEAGELYREKMKTPEGRLYIFTFMGWGRIKPMVEKVIKSYGLRVGEDRTGHPGRIDAILRFQGVSQEAREVIAKHPMILTWG